MINVIGYRVGIAAVVIGILLGRWDLILVNVGLVVLNKMCLSEAK